MSDQAQRTEKATPRRIQKARNEGQFISSRHLVGAVQFLVITALVTSYFATWFTGLAELMRTVFRRALTAELTGPELVFMVREILVRSLSLPVTGGLLVVGLVILSQLFVTRFGVSFKKLAPDVARLNPVGKLKGMARENFFNFGQALLMLPVLVYLVYLLAWKDLDPYISLAHSNVAAGAAWTGARIESLLWRAGMIFCVFGFVDFVRERHKYMKGLRMSKQEVRDELKETEGNIESKARVKRLMRARSRRRMIQDVRTATAVVINPTHYAVALRYGLNSPTAPVVVAKGKNLIAKRIREVAAEHHIAVVENPPLARALYASVEVGQEIPAHLYRAVAELIAHVYKLLNGYSARGR